jgi:hypothetical protein
MYQLEEMQILIDSHRTYLRNLAGRCDQPDAGPSLRNRLGALIVRFGTWVGNQCQEIAPEPRPGRPGLSHP